MSLYLPKLVFPDIGNRSLFGTSSIFPNISLDSYALPDTNDQIKVNPVFPNAQMDDSYADLWHYNMSITPVNKPNIHYGSPLFLLHMGTKQSHGNISDRLLNIYNTVANDWDSLATVYDFFELDAFLKKRIFIDNEAFEAFTNAIHFGGVATTSYGTLSNLQNYQDNDDFMASAARSTGLIVSRIGSVASMLKFWPTATPAHTLYFVIQPSVYDEFDDGKNINPQPVANNPQPVANNNQPQSVRMRGLQINNPRLSSSNNIASLTSRGEVKETVSSNGGTTSRAESKDVEQSNNINITSTTNKAKKTSSALLDDHHDADLGEFQNFPTTNEHETDDESEIGNAIAVDKQRIVARLVPVITQNQLVPVTARTCKAIGSDGEPCLVTGPVFPIGKLQHGTNIQPDSYKRKINDNNILAKVDDFASDSSFFNEFVDVVIGGMHFIN